MKFSPAFCFLSLHDLLAYLYKSSPISFFFPSSLFDAILIRVDNCNQLRYQLLLANVIAPTPCFLVGQPDAGKYLARKCN